MPAQFISLSFWAIDEYPDQAVLFSGLIVSARGLGMLGFGLIGGAIADRFERRRVLFACECGAFSLTIVLAILLLTKPFGDATIAAVIAFVFIAAVTMAIDQPSRTALVPVIVGRENLGRALGIFNVAMQVTAPVALLVVGVLVSAFGPGAVLAGSAGAFIFVAPLVLSMRVSSRNEAAHAPRAVRPRALLFDIREGLRYARADTVILPVMAMVVVMQVVGMPGVGMLGPVWMTEVLGLSRAQFGLIAMIWGFGAFAGSATLAANTNLAAKGSTLAAFVVLFGISGIVFGHSRIVALTAIANFSLGVAMAGMMLSSATIVQYRVAEEMRGRVMGLFPLIMGLSMLNVGPVSAAGQAAGLPVVVPALEWAVLVLAILILVAAPALRRVQSAPASGPPPAVEPAPAPAEA
jgi:MFS family permease